MYVTILVLLQAAHLISAEIGAVVARHVGAVLWLINKISIFIREDRQPWIYSASTIV